MGEIEVPESSSFMDSERNDKMSIRLSNFDNQLDFLVNFYQLSVDSLTLDRIKRMLALIRYIDWVHFSLDPGSCNTKAMCELVAEARAGADPLTLSLISESLGKMERSTSAILSYLKEITDFNREVYKFDVRTSILQNMNANESSQANIKKKFPSGMPGVTFYPDLVDEIIREDSAKDGPALQEKLLKKLAVKEEKAKIEKKPVSFKLLLIEGLYAIGSVGTTLGNITIKLDENEQILANRKPNFWENIRRMIAKMMNKEPEPTVYEIEYMDPNKGVLVKETVNFNNLRMEMDRKVRVLSSLNAKSTMAAKLQAMDETQLLGHLDRNIRDLQIMHKTLSGLDDYFKAAVERTEREKIRGIKPELADIKNAAVRASQKRYEYNSQKEEEEQLKRLTSTSAESVQPGAAG
ncbi:hypothetical protein FACS1894151_11200 [Spirochaetia bacterium]|nr:hypothetical protein FACS1894151_11200 [Spirochaetia bacterium]